MRRRKFLKTSIAAAGMGTVATMINATQEKGESAAREFYELRVYHLRRGPKQKLFDDFFKHAAIPAMNRAGIGPVGVFSVMVGASSPDMYVLITHKSIESFVTATDRLLADPEYLNAGAEFLNAPATDPSYVRVESWLMGAIEGVPKIEVPAGAAQNKPRMFELRTY